MGQTGRIVSLVRGTRTVPLWLTWTDVGSTNRFDIPTRSRGRAGNGIEDRQRRRPKLEESAISSSAWTSASLTVIPPLVGAGIRLGRAGWSWLVPGCGRHPERTGIGRPAPAAERLVEVGQATAPSRRLHGDVAVLGVHHQRRPRRVARAAKRRPGGHGAPAWRRAGLAPVSRATSATSSSA